MDVDKSRGGGEDCDAQACFKRRTIQQLTANEEH